MRVRLYEVGSKSVGVVLIDEFPTSLAMTDDGQVKTRSSDPYEICRLEDIGGQIFLKARDGESELEVNNSPLEEGPLLPGDRLRMRGHDFLVSYEATSDRDPRPARYRIQR